MAKDTHTDETAAGVAAAEPGPITHAPDENAGIKHLRSQDSGALRIWTVKGGKETGGKISAVFMPETSKLVMLHQLENGKFSVFEKV